MVNYSCADESGLSFNTVTKDYWDSSGDDAKVSCTCNCYTDIMYYFGWLAQQPTHRSEYIEAASLQRAHLHPAPQPSLNRSPTVLLSNAFTSRIWACRRICVWEK